DILGVAKHVFSVIEFKNKEKPGTGKKASILLADATGEVFVTFWHKDTEKIQNIPSGTPILLRGVSVSSYNNQTQVSFGYRSQLETNPSQAQEITLPQITLEKISIKEIQPPLFNFCLEATVDEVLPVKEFITQKGENGKLQRIRLMDKNDSILAVAWNEKVLESEMLKPGQKILLENVRAKTDWQGGKEISLDKNARIIVLEEKKEV
ncbi:hypothetical protein KKE06_02640, partial [Candidatus Micrarchaeota archaeon]|nr:hypothetical protein [Candidatus Micrarchaeota archaeon]MBU1930839.1 hypothetical protein [Candidatus Micrarchaeota archaeon]